MPHPDGIESFRVSLRLACVGLFLLMLAGGNVFSQLPVTRLGSVFPPGGNPGKSLDVIIDGEDLDECQTLRFSHAGITAKQKMAEPGPFDKGPVPVTNQFEVVIAANVPPGLYDVRALGKYGMSNPRAFMVGTLPEVIEQDPNESRETALELTLPCVLNGQAERATDVDWFKITPSAGQRLLIDCQARRIDSQMDPIVSVFDSAGRELDSSRDSQAGDPLVDFTVPAAGDYFIRINDALYRGNDGKLFYFYRLSVGMLPRIDYVFPPAAAPGNGAFTVFGRNLPGGQPAGLTVNGKPLQKVSVNIPIPAASATSLNLNSRIDPEVAGLDGLEYRIKGAQDVSNPVLIGVASEKVITEAEPNSAPEAAQKLATPCEVAGQFFPQRDDDWFSFEVKAGERYAIEVISQRLGADTDPRLLLQEVTVDAEGKEVVRQIATVDDSQITDAGAAFDAQSDDPSFQFEATKDAICRILLRDANGGFQADPRSVYRLIVRKPQPDFRLAAAPVTQAGGLFLRKGGSEAVQVVAFRREGFDGEIQVTATGLPAGVKASPLVLGPTQTCGLLVLTAADNAAPNTGFIEVSGKASVEGKEVARIARPGTLIWPLAVRQNVQQVLVSGESRVCSEIAVSISEGEVAPVIVTAGQDKAWETSRGGILKIPYAVTRRENFKGAVALIARDLPANIPTPLANVAANATSGEYELKLSATTPTGTYTFFLDALAQNVSYARNPESAKTAADRKVEIDKFNTDAIAAAKTALAAKQAADKVATDATNATKAAETAQAAADKAVADAEATLKDAIAKATQAKAAAAANTGDANLAAAATAAAKAVTDAEALLKTAQTNATAAAKKLEEALAALKIATEAQEKANVANDEAIAFAKLAADEKVKADKNATATANAAKPANRNVFFPSTPVTLKVTSAPITLTAADPPKLKQGMMVEVPVNIARLYDFSQQVNLSVVLPGLGGFSIPNVPIPAGQTAVKIPITAAANATEGMHEIIVRATLNFNGQPIVVDQPVKLAVEKAEAAAN